MIKKLTEKLKKNRGETLVETLCGILVVTLAVFVLMGAAMAAQNVNTKTKNADAQYRAELEAAEGGTNVIGQGSLSIEPVGTGDTVTIDISYFGSRSGNLTTFDRSGGGTP